MRRKLDNKAIFYVGLVALFTLLSYSFDQLVIRQEDKIRLKEIEYSNLVENINELENLEIQLTNLSQTGYDALTEYLVNRYFNFKNYLKLNYDIYGKKSFEGNFSDSDANLIEINKTNMINEYEVIYLLSFNYFEKLQDIFLWNMENYKPFNNFVNLDRNYLESFYDFEPLWKKNIDQFENKNFDIYDPLSIKDNFQSFKLKEWKDLNRFKILMLENLHSNFITLGEITSDITKLVSSKEEVSIEKLGIIKSISSLKNQLILLSIIAQILSLFSLLILFRYLIINMKK